MRSETDIDFVLRTVEERDVRFVRLWFSDVLGNLKSFSISPEELEEAFEEGIGFDGSSIDGFVTAEASDLLAFPITETFQILPNNSDGARVATIFCNIMTPRREVFEGDPRSRLIRVFEQAEAQGYVPNVGPKIEYFYFDNDKNPIPLDSAGYFDLTPSDIARDLRRETSMALERLSISVQYSFHGSAPSQSGVELRYAEALSCADNIMTARLVIKQMAARAGLFASFMPKPIASCPGSSMILNQSLLNHEGENLFWAPKTFHKAHLSELAQHYVAGILHFAPEFMLVTNPTVNSYKRLTAGGEVPTHASWGRKNRSSLVRIPTHKPGKHIATRLELRSPDPTANPYLALAATIAAGLKGIELELELPEEFTGDAFSAEPGAELPGLGAPLPTTLGEAVDAFEKSELMREVMGDHIFNYLVESKRAEWLDFCSTVTDWEKDHYYGGV